MSRDIKMLPVVRETLSGALSTIAPTFLWFLLYATVTSSMGLYSEYGSLPYSDNWLSLLGLWGFEGLLTVTLSCAWAVSAYRYLLPRYTQNSLLTDIWKLTVAALLVILVFILMIFIVSLFLVIFSAILVAASGYDPSGSDAADISASVAALQASGAIWLIYAVSAAGLAVLIWFGGRLMLYGASTVVQGRVMVFQSWGLTKGAVLKIALLATLLVGIPFLLMLLANEATAHVLGLATSWSPDIGFAYDDSATPITGGFTQAIVSWLLASLYELPIFLLGHSLAAALYRRLGPETIDAEATFS